VALSGGLAFTRDSSGGLISHRPRCLRNGTGRGCRVYATKRASRTLIGKVHIYKSLDKAPYCKPLPGGLQLFTLDTEKIKDMVIFRPNQAVENGPYASYLHKDTERYCVRRITAEEKQRDRKGNEVWVQLRRDNHLFDCEGLAQIVVDPEWPGGGLNLVLRGSKKPNIAFEAEKKKRIESGSPPASSTWLYNTGLVRPDWLSR
jgi:hypothetical protein